MIDITSGTDQIVICAQINVLRDRVWRALTEEEQIAEWWGGYVSLDAYAHRAMRNTPRRLSLPVL